MCVAVIVLMILVALVGPSLAPYSPAAQNLLSRYQPPSPAHWLGTDDLGRDVFTRLIYATRVSLLAALQAISTMLVLALPTGLLAGYRGGWTDLILGRVADALLSVPPIVLAIAVVSALGPGLTNAMVAVGLTFSPSLFRVVRATTLNVRDDTYVQAAVVGGCSTPRILVRHVLPNVMSPVLVQITIMISLAILAEAGLSFIGLGVQPPEASWGVMLSNAFRAIYTYWPLMIWPGLCIMAASLSFSLLGDVLRDSLGRGLGGR
jgi:peptide/nickel transport system permease protein